MLYLEARIIVQASCTMDSRGFYVIAAWLNIIVYAFYHDEALFIAFKLLSFMNEQYFSKVYGHNITVLVVLIYSMKVFVFVY